MKSTWVFLAAIVLLIFGCEPADDRPVITEGMELITSRQVLCQGGITSLELILGDSVVSPQRITYQVDPPIGHVDENGNYITPNSLESTMEVKITATPDFAIGSSSISLKLEASRLEDQIYSIDQFNNQSIQTRMSHARLGDGFVIINSEGNHGRDSDLRIIKLDNNGQIEWNKGYGKGIMEAIAVRKDHVFAAASVLNDGNSTKMMHTDSEGNLIWESLLNIGRIRTMAVNDAGELYVFTTLYGSSRVTYPIIKLDANGKEVWRKDEYYSVNQAGFNQSNELLVNLNLEHDPQVMVIRSQIAKINDVGEIIWSSDLDQSPTPWTYFHFNMQNELMVGYNQGGRSHLKKFSATGEILLAAVYEDRNQYPHSTSINDMVVMPDGNILLVGNIGVRMRVLNIAPSGAINWEWQSEGAIVPAISFTGIPVADGILIYGTYGGKDKGYIVKLDRDGNLSPCAQAAS